MSLLSPRLAAPLALLLLVTPVAAKDKDAPARPAQIDALYGCRDITDPTARLACYDKEVAQLAAADQAQEITFTDKETVKATRRGLFGFSFPKLGGIFGGAEDELKQLDTVLKSVTTDRSGKYLFTMEDGAVWLQIDTTKLPRDPKPGNTVEIKIATMGSYFVKIDGGRTIRMRRER